ncbi:RNA polymerase sporulation sigma factor SigK [Alicyclobacillaceae bacterium I2511]|nr:RNA polymerase sporulation sigma factor SigK [Alicyclobacillaceae bacterium I2511]
MPGLFTLLALVLKDVSVFVSYVKHNSFPKPLSAEAEAQCIERMAKGDVQARNQLIEHNLRLVAHLAKKFESPREELDDLISVGTIGLIKAVESYERTQGTKLATFAARCIRNEILMYLRSNKKHRRPAFLSETVGMDKDGNEMTLADLLGSDPDEVVDQADLTWERDKLYTKLPALPDREREVICKRFGLPDGYERTQREIAIEMGISRSYVSRIERKALNRLSEELHAGPVNS